MQTMQVTVDHPVAKAKGSSVAILTVSGELGFSAALGNDAQHSGVHGDTALYEILKRSLETIPKRVILDLHQVTYLSNLGMGALLRFQADIKDAGGKMRLAAPSDLLKALLERMRLDHAFKIYPDVKAAL
jgi:anti-sigma B factor antagonist